MKKIKNLGILLIAVAMTTSAYAQELKRDETPQRVVAKMDELYPSAKKVKFEKEDPNYEASFKMNKKAYSVLIDDLGNVLETEVEISIADVPASIMEYMNTNHQGKKIKETAQITKGAETQYEVEIHEGDLIFDSNGQLIKSKLTAKKKEKLRLEDFDVEID